MKRKLIAGLLAVLMLCVLIPVGAAAATFTDVPESSDYYNAVEWAVKNNITNGTSSTTFSPDATCTRGQVVTFLWRSMGRPEPATAVNPFVDVAPGSYCEKAVLWAVEQGITNGTSATTFSPDQTCTCGHILTFLWRAEGSPETGAAGPIASQFQGSWYSDAVKWAEYEGLIGSLEGFDPNVPCPRGMTVRYLYQVTFNESPQVAWNPTVIQRQAIFDAGSMCGVVYIGGFTESRTSEYINEMDFWTGVIADSGLTEGFPFLSELPASNVVQTPYGSEVYLIIPLDPKAEVSVLTLEWIEHEVKGYMYIPGEAIYHSYFGQPFLLCCNQSEILPDVMVRIVDSDGNVMEWMPGLSGKDGTVDTTTETGPAVCDLTQYPQG